VPETGFSGSEPGLARRQTRPARLGESSHSIAFTVEIRREKLLFHVILNAYWEPLDFELPRVDKTAKSMAPLDRHSPRLAPRYPPVETAASVAGWAYEPRRALCRAFCGSLIRRRNES